jgi:type VI secretion system protein ImpB
MPKAGAVKIGADKMRAPRAHPQTVVFTFGARKKQELPFVVGVLSDLAGKSRKPQPKASEREFLEINAEQPLEGRMAAMRPRVAFPVPNRLNDEGGNLTVDIEFESMDDFKPDRVATKVEPLKQLIEQRNRLKDLLNYLDGNDDAEQVLAELVQKVDALTKAKS